jgi:hypothetical protein
VTELPPPPSYTFGDRFSRGFFPLLRLAERWLSVSQLHALVQPYVLARSTAHFLLRTTAAPGPLPDFLRPAGSATVVRQQRRQLYLNRLLEHFPDRLSDPKWLGHCRIEGLDHVRQAQADGRPVILAFCHFGPYYLLRLWLRAAGLPVTMLVQGQAATRRRWLRFTDRLVPFPDIPNGLYQDQLLALDDFLAPGRVLGVALDARHGKQMTLPFCPGWDYQMPTGAVRLAGRHQAALIPCTIVDDGHWRFRIRLDPPVPREYLAADADWTAAGSYLLAALQPQMAARPDQVTSVLLRCLHPHPEPSASHA